MLFCWGGWKSIFLSLFFYPLSLLQCSPYLMLCFFLSFHSSKILGGSPALQKRKIYLGMGRDRILARTILWKFIFTWVRIINRKWSRLTFQFYASFLSTLYKCSCYSLILHLSFESSGMGDWNYLSETVLLGVNTVQTDYQLGSELRFHTWGNLL